MIKLLQHNQIDKVKWDACIKEAVNGMTYAQSWYLDIVATEWLALVENDYERVMPLAVGKKMKIQYLYQPVFTQQLGIISKKSLSPEVVRNFLKAIPNEIKLIEISLNTLNKTDASDKRFQNWVTHELDLINNHEQIKKAYSTNLKRKIKKAEKSALQVQKNIKPEEIIDMFRENRGKNIHSLGDEDYMKLNRLTYQGIYKGLMFTYGVYSPTNELCAGAIFLRSYRKIIFLFSGLNETGKQLNAMAFLINSFIVDHAENHLTLDFEGSKDPNLARFYQSFGSTPVYYPHLNQNKLPFLIKAGVKMAKYLRGLLR